MSARLVDPSAIQQYLGEPEQQARPQMPVAMALDQREGLFEQRLRAGAIALAARAERQPGPVAGLALDVAQLFGQRLPMLEDICRGDPLAKVQVDLAGCAMQVQQRAG